MKAAWSAVLLVACGSPMAPRDDSDLEASCGNGVIEGQEQCDDGNFDDDDGCLSGCEVARCGDGYVYADVEQCDDGNNRNGDACSADCYAGTGCGNGLLEAGEACDDGNAFNDDGCLSTCEISGCGDGFADLGSEQCDDGNQLDGDGCNADCTLGDAPNGGLCPGIAMSLSLTSDTHVVSNTFDSDDATTHSCGGSGKDAVYAVTPQADGWLIASLSGMQGGDAVLAVRSGDCSMGAELACANSNGANGTETAALQVGGGETYYVFVDSASLSPINYDLGLHLQQEIPGDDCPGIPMSLGLGAQMSLSGNTAVATSDQKGSGNCAAAAGTKDLVYAITPSHDGTLTIGVAPEFDAVLYARVGSCSLGMQIGCADAAGDGGNESLVINAVAGTKYSVVVDGYQGASGKFVLSADLQP